MRSVILRMSIHRMSSLLLDSKVHEPDAQSQKSKRLVDLLGCVDGWECQFASEGAIVGGGTGFVSVTQRD